MLSIRLRRVILPGIFDPASRLRQLTAYIANSAMYAPPSGTKTATIALTDTQRKVFSSVSAARNKHGLAAPNGARGQ
jgi:hypothetical protein